MRYLTSEFVLGFIAAICVLVIMCCIAYLVTHHKAIEKDAGVEYNISNERE